MPRPRPALLLLLGLLAGGACSPDRLPGPDPRIPPGPSFSLNYDPGSVGVCLGGQPTALPPESLPNPLAPGDYFTTLLVDPATTLAGDGRHFTRVTDAITAVRSGRIARGEKTAPQAACRITISVVPGTYVGSFTANPSLELFPLVLDVPRVTLEGALQMRLDAKGRANGLAEDPLSVSVLRPQAVLGATQAIIIVTDSSAGLRGDGVQDTRGDSVTIRGFAFQSGAGTGAGSGFGIFSLRAQALRIEGNRFDLLLGSPADLRLSTAIIERNAAATSATGSCTFCLAGPGNYEVRDNSIVQSGLVGILTTPVAPLATTPGPAGLHPDGVPAAGSLTAVITNNLVRDQVRVAVGTAIRIITFGNGGATVPQSSNVTVTDNELRQNRFDLILDAGFTPPGLDPAFPTGDLSASLSGNIFANTCETSVLVSFTRHTKGLGLPTGAAFSGALRQSDYVLTLNGNIPWSSVWYHHPAADSGVTLNNTLTVDGAPPILNGTVHAYNPAPCATPPVAQAGGPYTGSEGGSVSFNGAGSVGTGLSYAWTFGDGGTGTGPNPTHSYADDGVYEVTLVVTDAAGLISLPSITSATIANAAPNVGAVSGPAEPTPIATTVAVSAPFTDAGPADTHTATIDWGDGSVTAGTVSAGTVFGTHAYVATGTYQVTVTVKDDELATGSAVLDGVVIAPVNSPSAVWIGLKNSGDVGTKFDLKAEVLRNGSVIAIGQLNAVPGGSSGFNNAVQRTIAAALNTAPAYGPGDVLGMRLSVRIAVGVPGHASGTARLWYNDAAANSAMTTLVNGVATTWYLGAGFSLTSAPGTGPKSFVDVLVNKNVGGNPFKPFGTWNRVF